MTLQKLQPDLRATHLRFGIVQSRFNAAIGEGLLTGALRALAESSVEESSITIATVPGALEVPLALQRMAQTGDYDALIAIGAVIRGETYHFEIVATESASGISSVQLEFGIPIGNAVLTCETDDQALARMEQKGYEATA